MAKGSPNIPSRLGFVHCSGVMAVISVLDSFCAREQTAVECVYHRRSSNHTAAKVAAIETLDGVLASLHSVEF